MDLTPYQQQQTDIALECLDTLQREAKTANHLRIILIVTQGLCWISVVWLVALYVFRRIP